MRPALLRSCRALAFACALAFVLSPSPAAVAQPPAAKPDWAPFSFLIGEWVGAGSGSAGEFSLQPDLQGNVLVRKNVATAPTGRHEDLMVIYPEAPGLRAIYFDNEGHVIHYRVTAAESQAVFTSEEGPGPRFRLTYRKNPDGTVRTIFEIAPPGGELKTYLEGTVRRK
jgi:hypothetical protein